VTANKKIRVAQCLAGAPFGGAENFYTRLVCALANDEELEQKAFTRPNEHRVPQLQTSGVPVQTFRFGSKLHLIDNCRYRIALRRFKPDIVLTYMNRPSELTPRGKYALVCRLGHYYDLKYYCHADYWIGVSKGICQYMIKGGLPANRIVHIPNFVDETYMPALPRDSFGTATKTPLLLAAGRLHVNKAFDVLFQALAEVPDATLWLAGDGPEKENLRELANHLGILKRIRFLGWRDDIGSLMRTADIFVCPSRHEGLGSIVPESWYNNCPIVATASQGPGELIEHQVTGLLSPVDDVAALVSNIKQALSNKDLCEALANNGKREYEANYAEEKIIQRYKSFFKTIVTR
jgi:glycosyltransferase involved in cell wall biosynthesis